MKSLSPKKLEIQEREQKILSVARSIVVREGYQSLNMERIAGEVEYSRGTIYNHFSSKDEIIITLAEKGAAKRVEMFREAASYPDVSRFRMLSICYAAERFVINFPDYFLFEQIFNLDSVREKTSHQRLQLIHTCEVQCMEIVSGVVRDAITHGDLTLPTSITPERLVYGLWALTSGAYSLAFTSQSLPQIGITDPYGVVRTHVCHLLDGYQWSPLSATHSVDDAFLKIEKTLGQSFED
jgi:AcrR family transcriptional regulator